MISALARATRLLDWAVMAHGPSFTAGKVAAGWLRATHGPIGFGLGVAPSGHAFVR
jgi:hypothetical protein